MGKLKPRGRVQLKTTLLTKKIIIASVAVIVIIASVLIYTNFFDNKDSRASEINPGGWKQLITADESQITINTTFADFPLLVKIQHNDLKHVSHGGHVRYENGSDIYFTSLSEEILTYEIDEYRPVEGLLVAWVKMSSFGSDNNQLYMFYGGDVIPATSTVWAKEYKGVWHFNGLNDATSHNHSAVNMGTLNTDSKIGSGKYFDGTNAVQIPSSNHLNIQGKTYWSLWINPSSVSGTQDIVSRQINQRNALRIYMEDSLLHYQAGQNCDQQASPQKLSTGQWYHIGIVGDGANKTLYLNGVEVAQIKCSSWPSGSQPFILGASLDASGNLKNNFKGYIDEFRIVDEAMSANWIKMHYISQSDSEAFLEFGSPESISSSLPIQLGSFTATKQPQDEKVLVKWTTYTEINNNYFTIERSADGINFTDIGEVVGAGNSSQMLAYEYEDTSPLQGNNYYRLKQTDFDGQFEIFQVAHVFVGNNNSKAGNEPLVLSKAYPNPFQNIFTVVFQSNTSGLANVYVSDMSGRVAWNSQVQVNSGENKLAVDAGSQLSKGIWLVSVEQNGYTTKAMRVVKE